MMRIYDWAKGKTGGFLPKDVARVFGMDPRRVQSELRDLCYDHKLERRKQKYSRRFRYYAVLPPEEQAFLEPEPRPELFPLVRLPEGVAKAITQAST